MPVGAIVGATAVGVGSSAIASSNNKKAIEKSTDSSLQANRESLAAQQKMFDQSLAAQQEALNRNLQLNTDTYNSSAGLQTDIYNQNVARLNPYVQTGYSAMNSLNAMLGLPKQAGYDPQAITFTPIAAPAPVASAAQPANALLPNGSY